MSRTVRSIAVFVLAVDLVSHRANTLEDSFEGLLGRINDGNEIHVFRGDHAFRDLLVLDPVNEASPVSGIDKDDGIDMTLRVSMNESEGLEELDPGCRNRREER